MNELIKQHLMLFGAFFIVTMVAMYPSSFNMGTYKYGSYKGSDSMSHIYMHWNDVNNSEVNEQGEPWIYNIGAPKGIPHRMIFLTQYIAYPLTIIVNEVFSYNAIIFLSFILSGIFTYFFLFKLTKCPYSSFLGGLLFMLSPYHQLQAADHINLAQTWVFPLYAIFLFRFLEEVSYKNALLLACVIGFTSWVHGYYSLFLIFMSATIFPYLLLTKKIELNKKNLTSLVILALTTLVLIIIWMKATQLNVNVGESGVSSTQDKPISHLYKYGIRLYELFIPPYYSMFFGQDLESFIRRNSHGSNFAELTICLGYIPMILSFSFLYFSHKRRKMPLKLPSYFLPTFLILLIAPVIFGLPPEVEIWGIKIPSISMLTYKVLPMLRTISRFAVITIFSVSILGALGFWKLTQSKVIHKGLITSLISFFVLLEFGNFHNSFYLDTGAVPPVYQELKKEPGEGIVLEMPYHWGYYPRFWKLFHGKKLFNIFTPFPPRHENFKRVMAMQQIKNLALLKQRAKSENISYIIIHSEKPLNVGRVFKNSITPQVYLPPYAKYSTLIKI